MLYYNPDSRYAASLLTEIAGEPIASIGDIQPDGKGGLYGGVVDAPNLVAGLPARLSPLFHLHQDGSVRVVRDDILASNGIGFSPDGRLLYHAESYRGVWSYAVAPDGGLSERRLFSQIEDCDGLAVDAEGGIWVASPQACEVVRLSAANGGVIDRISTPGRWALSVAFAGSDLRDLYIVTAGTDFGVSERGGAVFRTRAPVAGLPTPLTRFAAPPQGT